jgi:hypothetical protein
MIGLFTISKIIGAAGALIPAALKSFFAPVFGAIGFVIGLIPPNLRPFLAFALASVAAMFLVAWSTERRVNAEWDEKIRIERERDAEATRQLIQAVKVADAKAEETERQNDELEKKLEAMGGGDGRCDWFGDEWLRNLNRIK